MPAAVEAERFVVVADAHLRSPSDDRSASFADFLALRVARADGCVLVIAGDLFDFCRPLPGLVPRACREIVGRLAGLPRVVWVEGNHDFGLAGGLPDATSIDVRPRDVVLLWGGRRVYVQHGDLVEARGRLTRSLLCSTPASAAVRMLGVERTWRLGSAVGTRRSWRPGCDRRRPAWLRGARAFAAARRAEGFDLTVLGHGHWLGHRGELVCLGDWPRHRSYLDLGACGEVTLRRFERSLPEDPPAQEDWPSPR